MGRNAGSTLIVALLSLPPASRTHRNFQYEFPAATSLPSSGNKRIQLSRNHLSRPRPFKPFREAAIFASRCVTIANARAI